MVFLSGARTSFYAAAGRELRQRRRHGSSGSELSACWWSSRCRPERNEVDAVPLPIPGIGDRSGEGRMQRPGLQWTATIASM
jgi:hypothetical protein